MSGSAAAAAPRWMGGRSGVAASVLVVAGLLLLESGALPEDAAQRATDLLQLVIAGGAALACAAAAVAPAQRPARAFFAHLGVGCLVWASGQLLWVLRTTPFAISSTYGLADLPFVGSTVFFVLAFVVRPDRDGLRYLPLLLDVVLAVFTMLYLFAEIALPHLLAGDVPHYREWSTFLFDFRALALLPVLLWSLRIAAPAWRPLYADFAPAFVVLYLGGVVTNLSFEPGFAVPYHPGLYDLPWTLPFLWLGLVAAQRRREPAPAGRASARAAIGWLRARRATIVAFASVLLVPLFHFAVAWDEPPGTPVARWRAAVALGSTLLVAGLYLVRQQLAMREAEQALREGEERYVVLLDSGSDGVGVYAPDMGVLYVNNALSRIGGYDPRKRVGHNVLELAHPDDAAGLHQLAAALVPVPGARARHGFRARHVDGGWFHLEVDVVNRLDVPAVRGMVANFRDVTERRLAEQERGRSLSLLEATLESTADGILVVDSRRRVVRYNQRFADMWRLAPEVLALGDADRLLAFVIGQLQEPDAFLDTIERLRTAPESESFDTLRFRDGRVVERYSLPQRLAGAVVGRVYSFRDVTERVRAEQAMARLVAIVDATPDFVGTCDASLRPLFVNHAGRRMLGFDDSEPLGCEHVSDFHPPAFAARIREEAIPEALRRGAWSGEGRLRRKDGHEIPVLQVVLAHRSAAGEVEFLSTIARDISQRIESEQLLRQSHTMAALGSLVAGVAHEVRNPLFGISSTLDAFEARFGAEQDHRPYVQVLREQLGRLNSLMHNLLEYAKPTQLELAQGRFEDVVAQALATATPLAERAHVELATTLAADLPPLRMDGRRLTQVLRNLLENAIQAARVRGRVQLEARLVERGGAACVECRVEDDGPGFDVHDLPFVFEPFFTRRHGGTGLGLSIVQRIVTNHGGEVAASNREAGGARLTLSLPVTRPEG